MHRTLAMLTRYLTRTLTAPAPIPISNHVVHVDPADQTDDRDGSRHGDDCLRRTRACNHLSGDDVPHGVMRRPRPFF